MGEEARPRRPPSLLRAVHHGPHLQDVRRGDERQEAEDRQDAQGRGRRAQGGPEGALVLFSIYSPEGEGSLAEALDNDRNVTNVSTMKKILRTSLQQKICRLKRKESTDK